MFVVGAIGAQAFTRVLRVPPALMMTAVVVIALLGAYGVRGNPLDLVIAFIAGIVGFVMRVTGFPIAPMVIGMVLAPMIENALRQSLMLTRGSFWAFFERPIALTLFVVTVAVLVWPVVRWLWLRTETQRRREDMP
jgi:putative tricarboxylic transport membrane protein